MIDFTKLERHLDAYTKKFQGCAPLPGHLVIDNFLDPGVAKRAYEVFPRMEEMDTLKDYRQEKEIGRASCRERV